MSKIAGAVIILVLRDSQSPGEPSTVVKHYNQLNSNKKGVHFI